jgi:chaperonin GroEL
LLIDVHIQDGKGLKDEVEVIEEMKFDQGALSRFFFTDPKTQTCTFEDPLILLSEQKISNVHNLIPILEKVAARKRRLLIIAENVEGDALQTLIVNRLRGLEVSIYLLYKASTPHTKFSNKLTRDAQVCAVKAPGFGESRTNNLQDIAVLTGGQIVSEEAGLKLEDLELTDLGSAKKITVSKDDTIILDGAGKKEDITERCAMLKSAIESATSDWDREKLSERLAKLSGGVAVMKVGGASEVELGEKKDRITDALNATKAAVAEGIVPGGGAALLYASQSLEELKRSIKSKNFDQGQGVQIIQDALKVKTLRSFFFYQLNAN